MPDERNPYAAPATDWFEQSGVAEAMDRELPLPDLVAEFARASIWLTISLPVCLFAAVSFAAFGLTMVLTAHWSRLILDGSFSLFASVCLGVLVFQLFRTRRVIEALRRQPDVEALDDVVKTTRNVFVTATMISAILLVLGSLYLLGEVFELDWRI